MTLQPGTQLGHYEITSLLGSGGMGEVYRAKDHKLGRDVAIKVLREELASDPERLRRFEQEARSASALNHPNIITIHDIRLRHLSAEGYGGQVGKTEDVDFIVMEFVEGTTLREMLSEGPLPTKKLIQIATQIAEGLAKAHSAGIIHRDLKPENLMVTNDGYVKILDFGLAKLRTSLPDTDSDVATMTKEGTAQGTVMGTVGYMSPEQAKGQPTDFRSDQFSLGAILYEMVTGKRAFQRDSSVQTLSAIIEQEPASIAALNPETLPHLRVAVERCLAKNPEERYDSTRDLARELKSIGEIATALPSEPIAAAFKKRRTWPRTVAIAGGMAAVLALVLALNLGGLRDWFAAGPSAPRIDSIAVLPLENLSGDPEQEYFADGMTDELIAELAQISALKVISRTSVMQYKGVRKPLPEIARELNVDAIVEGTVRRAEERVRITAQLIEADTDRNLWAESFERELSDVLALQSEVASAIAQEIKVQLTTEEESLLAVTRSVDPKAHEAYLKARYHWNQRTRTGLLQAIDYFEMVIEIDPEYAVAHAGLADAWLAFGSYFPQAEETLPKARGAAIRALTLDDNSAEAHASLGAILRQELDWQAAEHEYKKALALNPNHANTHRRYGMLLATMSRHNEAVSELVLAQSLDPLSLVTNTTLGSVLYRARRYDEAITALRRTLTFNSNFFQAYYWLGMSYAQKNKFEDSVEAFEKALFISRESTRNLAGLGYAYAIWGKTEKALEILKDLEALYDKDRVMAQWIAMIYTNMGEREQALEWLEKGYREGEPILTLKVEPIWDPLRDDPRFQDLLRRMNFPE